MNRIYKSIEAACLATGLPYSIENGGIHHKVFLGGRMVGVFSKGAHASRGSGKGAAPGFNIIAAIRRAAREAKV